MPARQPLQLDENETLLADACAAGEVCDLSGGTAVLPIRSEVVRSLLLGLPVQGSGEESARQVVLASGLRLRHAVLKGRLDLQGATAGGLPVPPLCLEQCLIDEPVDLSDGRFRYLSLAGSRISHLLARHVSIEGSIDLTSLASSGSVPGAATEGQCWVDLSGATIGGSVEATLAQLVAPPKRPDFVEHSRRAYYALDLTDARIDGTLHLRPGFRACGGVSVALARIAGDVLANGAEMIAVEGGAFHGQTAAIRGNLMLRAGDFHQRDSVPFQADGDVWLSGARIDGTLEMSGACLKGSLVAQHLHLGETAQLHAWQGTQGGRPALLRFVAGDVQLTNASIGGDLDLSGAELNSLSAEDATVGSNVRLDPWEEECSAAPFQARKDVSLAGARISGAVSLEGADAGSLSLEGAQVGGDVSLEVWRSDKPPSMTPCRAGAVSMTGVKIGGRLRMAGARFASLHAENSHIQGDVHLCAKGHDGQHHSASRFISEGEVSFRGATIQGELECCGAQVRSLTAEGATIERTARFSTAQCQQEGRTSLLPFEAAGQLSLFEATIKGTLTLNGARVGDLMAINVTVGGSVNMQAVASDETPGWRFRCPVVKLIGARIGHDLRMDGADLGELDVSDALIEGDVLMRAAENPAAAFSATSASVWDAQIGHGLRINGARIGDMTAKGARIGGPLIVRDLSHLRLREEQKDNPQGDEASSLLRFDLTDASAGTLDDQGGKGFGRDVLLVLDGFKYARLDENGEGTEEVPADSHPVGAVVRGILLCLEDAPRWVRAGAYWACVTVLLAAVLAPLPHVPPYIRLLLFLGAALALGLGKLAGSLRSDHGWRARLAWLNLQYPRRSPDRAYFRPDAYDQLAESFRKAGAEEDARRIVSSRLALERQLTERGLLYPFRWLFDVLFMHGLSPVRALAVFLVCIMAGVGVVTLADEGSQGMVAAIPLLQESLQRLNIRVPDIPAVLVAESRTVNSAFVVDGRTQHRLPALMAGVGSPEDLPCGDLIDPRLYAVELFVPALDLHQEEKCAVSSDAGAAWWRAALALYRAVGWIVTSLTILTMSGILRRHVED